MIPAAPAALLLLAGPLPAAAGSTEEHRAMAARLVQDGVQLRYHGREEEAYALFARADELAPSPRAKAQMALAAKSLRRYVEAERLLETALGAKDDTWVRDSKTTLEQALAFVQGQLAWLAIRAPTDGVELRINGRVHGRVGRGQSVRVPAGELFVELRAPGFVARRETITLPAGATRPVVAALEREGTGPGGKASAPVPDVPTNAAPAPSPWRTVAVAAGGASVAALAVGTFFGIRALDLRAQRDAVCPDDLCPTREGADLDRQGRRMGTAATVAFGVGLAGAATAAFLFLSGRAASPRGAALHVEAGPTRLTLLFDLTSL